MIAREMYGRSLLPSLNKVEKLASLYASWYLHTNRIVRILFQSQQETKTLTTNILICLRVVVFLSHDHYETESLLATQFYC